MGPASFFAALSITFISGQNAQHLLRQSSHLSLDPFISQAYQSIWLNRYLKDAVSPHPHDDVFLELRWFFRNPQAPAENACSRIPQVILKGSIHDRICSGQQHLKEVCLCIEVPKTLGGRFHSICGRCKNPCAIHFVADHHHH